MATLDQILYEAYATSANWKSLATDAPLPQWADLPEKIRAGWRAASEAAAEWVYQCEVGSPAWLASCEKDAQQAERTRALLLGVVRKHKKENICYCGHTVIEHDGVCQQPDCGCPEFVDSLEAASYLSGHHPTTCACDICRNARELVARASIAQQITHFTHWPVKSYCGAAIASIPINSNELTGDESRVTCQECLRKILRQKAEYAQISEQCKILGY